MRSVHRSETGYDEPDRRAGTWAASGKGKAYVVTDVEKALRIDEARVGEGYMPSPHRALG